jgi:Family of unknown function (DUF6058)
MSELDAYFSQHFLSASMLAAYCNISPAALSGLVEAQLLPAPSYIVEREIVRSHAFGAMPAPGAASGHFFHPATATWVGVAREVVSRFGPTSAPQALRDRFERNFQRALSELDTTIWPVRDCFTEDHAVVDEGMRARLAVAWSHFLRGTFGLCVAEPISEAHIARKEVLQEKLTVLSENGSRASFVSTDVQPLLALIDDYASATMPFSPIEYPVSSRKRLVDDLRVRLRACAQPPE